MLKFHLKPFIASVLIIFTFPSAIVTIVPRNIRQARLTEKAPRHTVTVLSRWTERVDYKTRTYWIQFQEPVAEPRKVQITSDEWNALGRGGPITIAVLPDGSPHTLNSGANVAFERCMLVFAVLVWLAATGYVTTIVYRWVRPRRGERTEEPVLTAG